MQRKDRMIRLLMAKYNTPIVVARLLGLHHTTILQHLKRIEIEDSGTFNLIMSAIKTVDHTIKDPVDFAKTLRLAFYEEYGIYPEVIHNPESSQEFYNMLE